MTDLTAQQLLGLLRAKHASDVFVPECKDGPTWAGGHLRLDAWVMPRSWSKPACTGYEIKISRADFLNDEKWLHYLPLCNRFYFVTPPGLLQPGEVPADAGLLVATKNAARLLTKKKAPHREVELPESLFRYVLMCRAKITGEFRNEEDADYWRAWLREKREKRQLGYNVSRQIRETVEERVTKVEIENKRLQAENEALAEAKKILKAAGINSQHSWSVRYELERRLEKKALGCIPEHLKTRLRRLRTEIDETLGAWDKLVGELPK